MRKVLHQVPYHGMNINKEVHAYLYFVSRFSPLMNLF